MKKFISILEDSVVNKVGSKIYWLLPAPYTKTCPLKEEQTNFTYYTPAKGQSCYSAKLPCTISPNKKLRLRANDLKSGFKIEANEAIQE